MHHFAKKHIKWLGRIMLGIFSLMVLFGLFAMALSLIPVNRDHIFPEEGVPIYIVSNGIHTDFGLPARNEHWDWGKYLSEDHVPKGFDGYVFFGWGEKKFYMETPTWNDLRFQTAFSAIFLPSQSVLRFQRSTSPPHEGKRVRMILLRQREYIQLVQYIQMSFRTDKRGNILPISLTQNIYPGSYFFEAHGRYHLFNTCNDWTNKGLKITGLRTAIWAPFPKSIFIHLGRE